MVGTKQGAARNPWIQAQKDCAREYKRRKREEEGQERPPPESSAKADDEPPPATPRPTRQRKSTKTHDTDALTPLAPVQRRAQCKAFCDQIHGRQNGPWARGHWDLAF